MIKAIVTDFDGTLVDTFEANLKAYQNAFNYYGVKLTSEKYRECFGYRFDRFMKEMNVDKELALLIRVMKQKEYPNYFELLKLNKNLIELISTFHYMGGKTAIASTANKDNLMNAVNYFGISNHFDLIYSGDDVAQGKPSPEIYNKTIKVLEVNSNEVMIFEDSNIGFLAAQASGAKFIPVTSHWFK